MRTGHLSAWEQEELLMGQQTPAVVQHLAACEECRLELGWMEEGIALFRASATEWSAETLQTRPAKPAQARTSIAFPVLGWALAALLLVVALLPQGLWKGKEAPTAAVGARNTAAQQDDALLEQVDAQVSAAVPSSMESLAYLSSGGENDTEQAAIPANVKEAAARAN